MPSLSTLYFMTVRCLARERLLEPGVGACSGLLHVASFFSDYKDKGILICWFSVQHFFEDIIVAILQVSVTKSHTDPNAVGSSFHFLF